MLAEALRLNVGSGEDRREGYLSVDLREEVADVVAPADHLPYADSSVEEILALDVLEHFPAFRTQSVLREWHRVLAPGGRLTVKVPNLLELARAIIYNDRTALMIRNIYGGHRWGPDGSYDAHHTGWTPDLFRAELTRAGFDVLDSDAGPGVLNMTFEARS